MAGTPMKRAQRGQNMSDADSEIIRDDPAYQAARTDAETAKQEYIGVRYRRMKDQVERNENPNYDEISPLDRILEMAAKKAELNTAAAAMGVVDPGAGQRPVRAMGRPRTLTINPNYNASDPNSPMYVDDPGAVPYYDGQSSDPELRAILIQLMNKTDPTLQLKSAVEIMKMLQEQKPAVDPNAAAAAREKEYERRKEELDRMERFFKELKDAAVGAERSRADMMLEEIKILRAKIDGGGTPMEMMMKQTEYIDKIAERFGWQKGIPGGKSQYELENEFMLRREEWDEKRLIMREDMDMRRQKFTLELRQMEEEINSKKWDHYGNFADSVINGIFNPLFTALAPYIGPAADRLLRKMSENAQAAEAAKAAEEGRVPPVPPRQLPRPPRVQQPILSCNGCGAKFVDTEAANEHAEQCELLKKYLAQQNDPTRNGTTTAPPNGVTFKTGTEGKPKTEEKK